MRRVASLVVCVVSAWVAGALQPHPRVLQARWEEELLPPHQRSRALHNPHLRSELVWSSSLHNGEQQVYDSEADRIPRSEIFAVLAHAGLVPRRGRRVLPAHRPAHHHKHHLHSPPRPGPGHHLQYL